MSLSKARHWKQVVHNPDSGLVSRLSFTSEMSVSLWLSCAISGGGGLGVFVFSDNFTFWLHYSWDSDDMLFLQWSEDWFGQQLFTPSAHCRDGTSHWTVHPKTTHCATEGTNPWPGTTMPVPWFRPCYRAPHQQELLSGWKMVLLFNPWPLPLPISLQTLAWCWESSEGRGTRTNNGKVHASKCADFFVAMCGEQRWCCFWKSGKWGVKWINRTSFRCFEERSWHPEGNHTTTQVESGKTACVTSREICKLLQEKVRPELKTYQLLPSWTASLFSKGGGDAKQLLLSQSLHSHIDYLTSL